VFLAIERDGAGGKAPRCVTECLRTLINMHSNFDQGCHLQGSVPTLRVQRNA
jgi:hypothetical protein